MPSHRLERTPFRDNALSRETPERHQELARERHDQDLAHAPARLPEPLDEPPRQRATGLIAKPEPRQFDDSRSQPPVTRLRNPLFVAEPSARKRRPDEPCIRPERLGRAEVAH